MFNPQNRIEFRYKFGNPAINTDDEQVIALVGPCPLADLDIFPFGKPIEIKRVSDLDDLDYQREAGGFVVTAVAHLLETTNAQLYVINTPIPLDQSNTTELEEFIIGGIDDDNRRQGLEAIYDIPNVSIISVPGYSNRANIRDRMAEIGLDKGAIVALDGPSINPKDSYELIDTMVNTSNQNNINKWFHVCMLDQVPVRYIRYYGRDIAYPPSAVLCEALANTRPWQNYEGYEVKANYVSNEVIYDETEAPPNDVNEYLKVGASVITSSRKGFFQISNTRSLSRYYFINRAQWKFYLKRQFTQILKRYKNKPLTLDVANSAIEDLNRFLAPLVNSSKLFLGTAALSEENTPEEFAQGRWYIITQLGIPGNNEHTIVTFSSDNFELSLGDDTFFGEDDPR